MAWEVKSRPLHGLVRSFVVKGGQRGARTGQAIVALLLLYASLF